MPQETKSTLYLKLSCPFCLKVAAFLAEAGLFERLELCAFWPGDEAEENIRAELSAHFEQVSFPTVRLETGEMINESDLIIAHYARVKGLDPTSLPFFQYVLSGPVRRLSEQFREIKALNEKLSAAV